MLKTTFVNMLSKTNIVFGQEWPVLNNDFLRQISFLHRIRNVINPRSEMWPSFALQKGLSRGNIGLLISNAKASAFACPPAVDQLWRDRQMSKECQRPKPKNEFDLPQLAHCCGLATAGTLVTRHLLLNFQEFKHLDLICHLDFDIQHLDNRRVCLCSGCGISIFYNKGEPMNGRKRFRETMGYGKPDRVPFFEEGIRKEVRKSWRRQSKQAFEELSDILLLAICRR